MTNKDYSVSMVRKRRESIAFLLIITSFLIFILMITCIRLKQQGSIMAFDAFFHTSRISEIDYYFRHLEIPNWLNFQSFNRNGQAINGMYPDLTLWPFIILTIGIKSIVRQIVVIRSLILIFAFIVTLHSLIQNNFDKISAALVAVTFVLSGFYSSVLYQQFQPNTMLAVSISFPLLFSLIDIFNTKQLKLNLVIKVALLMSWLLFSHLVSVVVVIIVIVVVIVSKIFLLNRSVLYAIYNLSLAALLTTVISVPFLYRYYKISSAGLLPPFRAGVIGSEPFMDLITKAKWNATNALPLASLFCLVLVIVHHPLENKDMLLKLSFVEFILMVFCTSLVPWSLLNKVPIINNFQYAQWRFAIFLGIIPFVLFLMCYSPKYSRSIMSVLTIIAVLFSVQSEYEFHYLQYNTPVLNGKSLNQKPISGEFFVQDSAFSNYTNRFDLPDYAPKNMKTKTYFYKNDALSDKYTRIIWKHRISNISEHTFTDASLESINNGVVLKSKGLGKGVMQLPIVGYRSLRYKVMINNKRVSYRVNNNGFIQICYDKDSNNANVRVMFNNPIVYNALLIFSICVCIIYIILYAKLRNL